MKKILQKLWNNYCQPAMIRADEELADSKALIQLAREITDDYGRRRQQRYSSDAELGSKFQRLFDNNLVAMSFYDHDGVLINLNDKMRELCAIDSIGDEYFRKTRLFDTPSFKADFSPEDTEPFYVCQHMLFPELGINRYIEVHVQPIFERVRPEEQTDSSTNGKLQYYVITSRDISNERLIYIEQQQHAEEQQAISKTVGEYEQRLNYLLRSANMYAWWLDVSTQVISFTRSLRKQEFSQTLNEYLESIYEDERPRAVEHMKDLLVNPHTFNIKHHFLHTPVNPRPQYLYINGQPLLDNNGNVIALFGILRDVTAMMETQHELHKEHERAQQSAYIKSTFLANMSHELRTPLNAIVGFSDLLQVVDDTDERQHFIRIIRTNADLLLRLIDDIFAAADMQHKPAITPVDVDFSPLFDDICKTLQQRVQEPDVQFITENPYEHLYTTLDKERIQQVITNFVTNAVKHTRHGHIRLSYRYQDEGLFVSCEDTGSGIPKDKQQSVFERFVKLNDQVQGTGIGLSICKNIVERCGGEIGVDSKGEGKGSTFWFWIPCKQNER